MYARRKDSMEYEGLHTGSQDESLQPHWPAGLSFPDCRSSGGLANAGRQARSQVHPEIPSWILDRANPRAPPIPIAAVS